VVNLLMVSPLSVAVERVHCGFWRPTADLEKSGHFAEIVPHLFSFWTPVGIGISLLTVLIGDLLFRKFEGNFAQEL